jgi:hypothetical protein
LDGGQTIEVEVARERYVELALQKGDQVYVSPRDVEPPHRFGRERREDS